MNNILTFTFLRLAGLVLIILVGCTSKEPTPDPGSGTAVVTTSCCADSTNDYPDGKANAIYFEVNSACITELNVELQNLSSANQKYTIGFQKDGGDYVPVGLTTSSTIIMVGPGATVTKTFQCQGAGGFHVETSVQQKAGPTLWHVLIPEDPPPASSIVGTLNDTMAVAIAMSKEWYLAAAAGAAKVTAAKATFNVCRHASGSSASGVTALSLSMPVSGLSVTKDTVGTYLKKR